MTKSVVICAAGFCQGMCLILVPAASFIWTSTQWGRLTDQQYGLLFVAMVVAAVASSACLKRVLARVGSSMVFYGAIGCNLLYLATLLATLLTAGQQTESFLLLLAANGLLGMGFGWLVAVLNLLIVDLYPQRRDSALAALHASLGSGAAVAPLMVTRFALDGVWYFSAMVSLAAFGVILLSARLTGAARGRIPGGGTASAPRPHDVPQRLPAGARLFLLAVLVYGCVEAIIGNWTVTYLTASKNLSVQTASLSLSLFWAAMTVGRIATSVVIVKLSAAALYRALPVGLVIALVLVLLERSAERIPWCYVAVGLGCSSFFPLSISLSLRRYDAWRESLSTLMVTFLMTGIGIGSFVIGVLRDWEWISLSHAFVIAGVFAASLAFLAARLTRSTASEA